MTTSFLPSPFTSTTSPGRLACSTLQFSLWNFHGVDQGLLGRLLEPAVGDDDVRPLVAVDVADADAVALARPRRG